MKRIALVAPLLAVTFAGAALACEDKASMASGTAATLSATAPASTKAPSQAKAAPEVARTAARTVSAPDAKKQERAVIASGGKTM